MDDPDASEYNRRYSNLKWLLLLLCLAGLQPAAILTTEGEGGMSSQPDDDDNDGLEVAIMGPDYVTVGVPCSFECEANCPSSSCTYSMALDKQSAQGQGNVLAFTVLQWEESLTLTCTARDDGTGLVTTTTKKLQVLDGPDKVSITGSDLMNPLVNHSYSCHAYCRPSCSYMWQTDNGPWIGGQGNVISLTPQEMDTSKSLICKAINSVSGLFAAAVRNINVTSGPSEVHIEGPDTLEVARKSEFVCVAACIPSCRYLWTMDSRMLKGKAIVVTLERPVKSVTIKCEAQNTFSRKTAAVFKTVWMEGRSLSTRPELTSALLLFAFIVCTVITL